MKWKDKNGKEIKAGNFLNNPCNEPNNVEVLTNGAKLFLGDFDTPFGKQYAFHEFWEVVEGVNDV